MGIFKSASGQLRAGWRLALWFAIVFAVGAGVSLLARAVGVGQGDFLDPRRLILGDWIGTFLPVIVATLLLMRLERRSLRDYYIPTRDLLGQKFWAGALWGMAAVSLLLGLIALAGGYRIIAVALREHVLYYAVIWLLAAASIGIVEEIAFRGYMLRTLADGIGFWPAAILLSAGFGALHYFFKPHERWEDFASTGLLGLFMCFTIVRTGSLAWAMGWHFAFDWGAIFFYSGRNAGEYAPGRLFETAWPAGDRVTGGLLGPEASWFVFVVIVVLFLAFHFAYRRRALPQAVP
jgi:membrane protease YdiL (CAAX protease family)